MRSIIYASTSPVIEHARGGETGGRGEGGNEFMIWPPWAAYVHSRGFLPLGFRTTGRDLDTQIRTADSRGCAISGLSEFGELLLLFSFFPLFFSSCRVVLLVSRRTEF